MAIKSEGHIDFLARAAGIEGVDHGAFGDAFLNFERLVSRGGDEPAPTIYEVGKALVGLLTVEGGKRDLALEKLDGEVLYYQNVARSRDEAVRQWLIQQLGLGDDIERTARSEELPTVEEALDFAWDIKSIFGAELDGLEAKVRGVMHMLEAIGVVEVRQLRTVNERGLEVGSYRTKGEVVVDFGTLGGCFAVNLGPKYTNALNMIGAAAKVNVLRLGVSDGEKELPREAFYVDFWDPERELAYMAQVVRSMRDGYVEYTQALQGLTLAVDAGISSRNLPYLRLGQLSRKGLKWSVDRMEGTAYDVLGLPRSYNRLADQYAVVRASYRYEDRTIGLVFGLGETPRQVYRLHDRIRSNFSVLGERFR